MNLISFFIFLPSFLFGWLLSFTCVFRFLYFSGFHSYNLLLFSLLFFYPFLPGALLLKYIQLTVFPTRTVVSKSVNTVKVLVRNKIKSVCWMFRCHWAYHWQIRLLPCDVWRKLGILHSTSYAVSPLLTQYCGFPSVQGLQPDWQPLSGFTTHSRRHCFYHRVLGKDRKKIHIHASDLVCNRYWNLTPQSFPGCPQ